MLTCSSTVPAWRIWECAVHMHSLSNSQQHHPLSGSCTAELPLKSWHRQHATWACRDMHTAGVLYLCLSVHTERAKRGEKKPEINVRGRSEAMNSTYVTISKDTNLRICWVFPLGNVPPCDLFRKRRCEGQCSKTRQLKKWAYKFELHCIEDQKIEIWEEIKLEVHCNITGKTIFTQVPEECLQSSRHPFLPSLLQHFRMSDLASNPALTQKETLLFNITCAAWELPCDNVSGVNRSIQKSRMKVSQVFYKDRGDKPWVQVDLGEETNQLKSNICKKKNKV